MMHLSDAIDRVVRRDWLPRIPVDSDTQRRKQDALAERIASANADWKMFPKQWQLHFDRALREIQQFDKEFEEVRA